MKICVDATTLIALGTIDELELLCVFEGDLVIAPAIEREVTTEPARTCLERFLAETETERGAPFDEGPIEDARRLLGDETVTGDVQLVAAVLAGESGRVAIVSDDRRVRTTARSLGAPVTGTVGVVVRAVEAGLEPEAAKAIVRRLDRHGLHMTGELRERALALVETAAEE